ncbi:MAG: hypothetical protein FWD25_09280 [Clostridia bacterium]|nr:hypothetical protein [Clostridia bacterium]
MPHVSYQKASKRKRREIDETNRTTWGNVSPITRKVESAKVYNRKKIQRWHMEPPTLDFCFNR